jgi:Reverse transcriptase (RNA-dependent DNA polymerase)
VIKLLESSIQKAFAAVEHHGFGDFLPEPPEWRIVKNNWTSIRPLLADLDLDTFSGYDRIAAFAPKSKLNVRRVALLHPYDHLLYTALVLELRDSVSKSRLAPEQNRVFSYRAEGCSDDFLYTASPGFSDFRKAISDRFKSGSGYAGITDIADFYARIYQHRLVNALQAACTEAELGLIRALEKMLYRFSEGSSYGIPIGPPASRVLGEAVLIDVDSTLLSNGVDFVRFTDDYVIFASTPEDADYGIRVLGETLFLNHGLTLQTAKTRVMPGSTYVDKYLTSHNEKEETRRQLIAIVGDYEGSSSYEELDEANRNEIDALNLSELV